MSNSKKSSRWWLGGAGLLLLGLAIWWITRTDLPSAPVHKSETAVTSPSTLEPPSSVTAGQNPPAKPDPAPVAPVASVAAPVALPVATPPPAAATVVATPPAPANAPAVPAASANPSAPQSEIEASARMYAAHAPLRVPEIADPDSAPNKQILNTMVTKLITQPPRNPPAAEPTKS